MLYVVLCQAKVSSRFDVAKGSGANSNPSANANAMEFVLEQDPDVLDTWFSSALFPLTALGWDAGEALSLTLLSI